MNKTNFMLTLTHTKHKQKRDVCINGNIGKDIALKVNHQNGGIFIKPYFIAMVHNQLNERKSQLQI